MLPSKIIIKPRSLMMYGASGGTKTSQLYHLAKYIHETTGKKIRMIHGDPGGYAPFVDSGLIERGVVEVFNFNIKDTNALAYWRRLSEGYWPRYTTKGELYFKQVDACKVSDEEWKGIAGVFVESLTSIAETLRKHCSNQEGGLGLKESYSYEEDGFTFRGVTDFRLYNIVQDEIYERFFNFQSMPCEWLVVTALVGVGGVPIGKGKENVEPIYGPQVTGNAVTHRVPSWFANCFHLSTETWIGKNGESKTGKVAWFTEHREDMGSRYLCKSGMLPELFPKMLEIFPFGFVPLGFKNGVDVYFRVLEKLRKENLDKEK